MTVFALVLVLAAATFHATWNLLAMLIYAPARGRGRPPASCRQRDGARVLALALG